jgi:hypothetical protein
MLSRTACLAVVALLALQGCTSTVHYAVVAPHEALSDDGGCFRQCRRVHGGETEKYLACLRNCQGIRVVDGQPCEKVSFDAHAYQCGDEQARKFDPTVGLGIMLGVVVMVLLAVAFVVIANPHPYTSGD